MASFLRPSSAPPSHMRKPTQLARMRKQGRHAHASFSCFAILFFVCLQTRYLFVIFRICLQQEIRLNIDGREDSLIFGLKKLEFELYV